MNPGFKEEKKMVTLLAFQDELKTVARYWYKIGKELQVSDDDLKNIRSIHNKNYTKCLGSVYIEWNKLQTNSTWEKLVEALRGKEVTKLTVDVANAIQKKYCPDTHSLSPSMTSGKSFTLVSIPVHVHDWSQCTWHASRDTWQASRDTWQASRDTWQASRDTWQASRDTW